MGSLYYSASIFIHTSLLKLGKLLTSSSTSLTLALHLQYIEADSLGQGAALSHSHHIADLNADKGRGTVDRQVLVALLITVILADIVQVLTTDHNGALHLGADDGTGENASTNGNVTSKGALFVNKGSVDGLLRGLEAKADVLEPAVAGTLGDDALVVQEDGILLGKSADVLQGNE